jgi:hypothetical protein
VWHRKDARFNEVAFRNKSLGSRDYDKIIVCVAEALAVGSVSALASFYAGDRAVLAATGAQPIVDEARHHPLVEGWQAGELVVEEDGELRAGDVVPAPREKDRPRDLPVPAQFLEGPGGLDAVVGVGRDVEVPEQVVFLPDRVLRHHEPPVTRGVRSEPGATANGHG